MNISRMYVPNVGKCMKYYQDVAAGRESPYTNVRNVKQRGSGLTQNSYEFMIPIDENHGRGEKALPARTVELDLVLPVQQVVEQAKSELKRKRSPSARQSRSTRRRVRISKSRKHPKSTKKRTKKSLRKTTRVTGKNKKSPKKVKRNDLVSQWLR